MFDFFVKQESKESEFDNYLLLLVIHMYAS